MAIGFIKFANNAQSVLAGPLSPSSVTANLAAGSGDVFPSPTAGQYFALTITDQAVPPTRNEIVYCTQRSGDTVSILRAQEGTAAQSWATSDKIANFFTEGSAEALIQVAQLQVQAPNYGVDSGSVNQIVISLNPSPGSYANIIGSPIRVNVRFTNTGSSTININGLGAVVIRNADGSTLDGGELLVGSIAPLVYNGTFFLMEGGFKPYPYANPLHFLTNVPTPTPTPQPTPTPTTTGVVTFNGRNGNVQLSFGDVVGALGYQPLRNTTDTFTGQLSVQGKVVANGNLESSGLVTSSGGMSSSANIHANGNISSDQILLCGTSNTQPAQSGVQGSAMGAGYFSANSQSTASAAFGTSRTGGGNAVEFYYGPNFAGSVSVASGSASFNSGSDRRIKEDFENLPKGVYYTDLFQAWKYTLKGPEKAHQVGFIADEVQPYALGVVKGKSNAVEEDGSPKIQTMDYSRVTPFLWHDVTQINERLRKFEAYMALPWWGKLLAALHINTSIQERTP